MKIYVKKVDGVTLPQKGTEVAAGYDIVATSDPKIVGKKAEPIGFQSSGPANEWESIDYIEYETNLFIAPSAVTFHTLIHPRSSISKYNLVLANSIGLVDNDYRGMVICRFKYIWQPGDYWMPLSELGTLVGNVNLEKIYKKGDKIAQLVVEPTVMADWEFVDDLSQTARGEGGFGSTDQAHIHPKKETPRIPAYEPHSNILDKFAESGHDLPTPHKDTYINTLKEREKELNEKDK